MRHGPQVSERIYVSRGLRVCDCWESMKGGSWVCLCLSRSGRECYFSFVSGGSTQPGFGRCAVEAADKIGSDSGFGRLRDLVESVVPFFTEKSSL